MMITPILVIHIAAGSLALLSAAGALSVRKGGRLHRAFGTVFFPSMLIMAALGAHLAAAMPVRFSALMGSLTFYLVATAWLTVRRKEGQTGILEVGALIVALGIAATLALFGVQAANRPSGSLDGYTHTPSHRDMAIRCADVLAITSRWKRFPRDRRACTAEPMSG